MHGMRRGRGRRGDDVERRTPNDGDLFPPATTTGNTHEGHGEKEQA